MTKFQLKLTILVVVVLSLIIGYEAFKNPIQLPSNIMTPIQTEIDDIKPFSIYRGENTYEVTPLSNYTIQAVVKSRKNYKTDYTSDLSPMDFALAWGELNKTEVDEHIDYSQHNRWYYYRADEYCPVSIQYIARHSANTHIIPKDDEVEDALKKIHEGDYIELVGYLVEVDMTNGKWTSSLSRDDTGDGACEIMCVIEVKKIN